MTKSSSEEDTTTLVVVLGRLFRATGCFFFGAPRPLPFLLEGSAVSSREIISETTNEHGYLQIFIQLFFESQI